MVVPQQLTHGFILIPHQFLLLLLLVILFVPKDCMNTCCFPLSLEGTIKKLWAYTICLLGQFIDFLGSNGWNMIPCILHKHKLHKADLRVIKFWLEHNLQIWGTLPTIGTSLFQKAAVLQLCSCWQNAILIHTMAVNVECDWCVNNSSKWLLHCRMYYIHIYFSH